MVADEPKPFSQQFLADKWLDAVKLIGAGNSAAFFASAIAIYYFGSKPGLIPILKVITCLYFFGFMSFVVAISAIYLDMMRHDSVLSQRLLPSATEIALKTCSLIAAILATLLWLVGSVLAIITIIRY